MIMARPKKSKKVACSQDAKQTVDELCSLLEKLRGDLRVAEYFFDSFPDDGRTGAIGALGAVCSFIDAFDDFRDERLTRSLTALLLALGDATRGIGDPMLRPEKTRGRPPSDSETLRLRAHASVAMELYMKFGMNKLDASKKVARRFHKAGIAIPNRADDKTKDAGTIRKWRDNIKSGLPGKDEDTDCYLNLLAGIQADGNGLITVADRIIEITPLFLRPKNPQKPPS